MRFRRHLPPIHEWQLPGFDARGAKRWGVALLSSLVAGYLTAYLVVFPAPILRGHQVVPRVLGLSLPEASAALRNAGLQVQDGGSDPHPTAPQGTVVWQDPPPGVSAPAGLRVTLVASDGPPRFRCRTWRDWTVVWPSVSWRPPVSRSPRWSRSRQPRRVESRC